MSAVLSGPMFEPATHGFYESAFKKGGAHYNIFAVRDMNGMAALHEMFPDGTADEMNLCIFSTSGVHGTYTTIEEAEANLAKAEDDEERGSPDVTFLIIHPRIVCMRYGNCEPRTPEDFAFLKKLRETSWAALASIGRESDA